MNQIFKLVKYESYTTQALNIQSLICTYFIIYMFQKTKSFKIMFACIPLYFAELFLMLGGHDYKYSIVVYLLSVLMFDLLCYYDDTH